MTTISTIDSFRGKYYFLSNFFPAEVTYNGLTYQNNEAAFQAQKTYSKEERIEFTSEPSSRKMKSSKNSSWRPEMHNWWKATDGMTATGESISGQESVKIIWGKY